VILNKIHRFNDSHQIPPDKIERRYINLVRNSDRFQNFLKINDAYVFFMDLSQDYFLGSAIDIIQRDQVSDVAAEDAEHIADCYDFSVKYGSQHERICHEMQNIYVRFSKDIGVYGERLLGRKKISEKLKRSWFFSLIVDSNAPPPLQDLPKRFQDAVSKLMRGLIAEYQDIFDSYLNIINAQADLRSFHQSRPAMEAMVTNLLELLCWLDECRTAIRDLKPDNLLVVGENRQFPAFLESPGEFIVGLIDLETAVACPLENGGVYPQPLLGGTPSYATPSHFMTNDLLAKLYNTDVWNILHLQDWYAVLTIIFEVITGKRLFYKTGGQMQNIVKSLQLSIIKGQPIDEGYRSSNCQFWLQASSEFYEKLGNHSNRLEQLNALVPDLLGKIFSDFIMKEIQDNEKSILSEINSQEYIQDSARKQKLSDYSYQAICEIMNKYLGKGHDDSERIISFLKKIAELKKRQECMKKIQQELSNPFPQISVRDLLELMFQYVKQSMSFDDIYPETESIPEKLPETDDATLNFTHTVQVE
jgi:serine/threonine protein kinase